ncbi:uncharacterized protein LOC112686523 [Sipha flava]|uniref:Uncharacterized protein LOC112686523 n=1 Tax=Sipha flava TaxID=143950 RepID=A0A8B8FV01_9HEMI|nr:uncharacterized protein LOC112686523 [Sipha flava]
MFPRVSELKNEIIETHVEIPDVQREWELVHCVTLQDYLKINEDIAVYESHTKESIVEVVTKKENPDEFEEDEEEHTKEQSKFTEEDILKDLFVVNRWTECDDGFVR